VTLCEPVEIHIQPCRLQLLCKRKLPRATSVELVVGNTVKVAGNLDAWLQQDYDLVAAKPSHEETQLEDDVLPCPRLLLVRSRLPSDIIRSRKYDRKLHTRVRLELLDQCRACVADARRLLPRTFMPDRNC